MIYIIFYQYKSLNNLNYWVDIYIFCFLDSSPIFTFPLNIRICNLPDKIPSLKMYLRLIKYLFYQNKNLQQQEKKYKKFKAKDVPLGEQRNSHKSKWNMNITKVIYISGPSLVYRFTFKFLSFMITECQIVFIGREELMDSSPAGPHYHHTEISLSTQTSPRLNYK